MELLNKKENGAIAAFTETIERRDDHLHSSGGARQIRQGGITPARYFRWKGPFDRAAAAALLVPGLPLIALLVALVRLTSKGPGIYRQARVGKDGRRFMMYKIRTMRHDAEAGTGAVWTQTQDPRVTAVGKVFRNLHLDELPQLFNVLRGEMSLVGPRPERPEFVRVLAEAVPGYRNRLAVRPGITGLAQINLPPDTDIISVQPQIASRLRVRRARRDVARYATDDMHVPAALQGAGRLAAIPAGVAAGRQDTGPGRGGIGRERSRC